MPWQSNGGGGDRPNPWGNNQGGGGGRGEPPNFDDMIRKTQDKFRSGLPGGPRSYWIGLIVLVMLWIASGIYVVEPNEQAVVMRFGKFVEQRGSGVHVHLPYPIESVMIRGVTDQNTITIGGATRVTRRGQSSAGDNSLMLTGDESIVNVRFNVVWRIASLGKYLFNIREPEATIKSVSESVMRELVGRNQITPIITDARGLLQSDALVRVQQVLDGYDAGITILRVQINESEAPAEVADAFLEVQRAEADQQRLQNEARAYANRIVPEARGEANRMLQQAEAYKAQTVARAEGEAARFTSVFQEYRQAKSVTRKRIYLETMEDILSGMDKIILDGQAGSGVVPYLPLDQLNQNSGRRQGENR